MNKVEAAKMLSEKYQNCLIYDGAGSFFHNWYNDSGKVEGATIKLVWNETYFEALEESSWPDERKYHNVIVFESYKNFFPPGEKDPRLEERYEGFVACFLKLNGTSYIGKDGRSNLQQTSINFVY